MSRSTCLGFFFFKYIFFLILKYEKQSLVWRRTTICIDKSNIWCGHVGAAQKKFFYVGSTLPFQLDLVPVVQLKRHTSPLQKKGKDINIEVGRCRSSKERIKTSTWNWYANRQNDIAFRVFCSFRWKKKKIKVYSIPWFRLPFCQCQ